MTSLQFTSLQVDGLKSQIQNMINYVLSHDKPILLKFTRPTRKPAVVPTSPGMIIADEWRMRPQPGEGNQHALKNNFVVVLLGIPTRGFASQLNVS